MQPLRPSGQSFHCGTEVLRLTAEIGLWEQRRLASEGDSREIKDLAAGAVLLFDRILELDLEIRDLLRGPKPDLALASRPYEILEQWVRVSGPLLELLRLIEGPNAPIEAADAFRARLRQAHGILTPDDQFFGDGLREAEADALEKHRIGRTEPLFENEPALGRTWVATVAEPHS